MRWVTVVLVLALCTLLLPPALAAFTDKPPSAVFPCEGDTFVVKSDGSLWAFGNNNNGQLGDGTSWDRYVPVLITNHADLFGGNLTGVTSVKGGSGFSVALLGDGTVRSAGANDLGQLGERGRADPTIFVQVPGIDDATKVDAGEGHVLVLRGDGTVWSWGDNSYGQLGGYFKDPVGAPGRVPGIQGIRSIAAGARHSVATYGMETYAWGDNRFGQLGDGTRNSSNRPVKAQITGVTDVAAGEFHTLALADDGTVWAWGGNDYGQVGSGTGNDSLVPVKVEGLKSVKAIAAGNRFSLALKYDGTVWAWGYNGDGALGTGSTDRAKHPEPVQVKGLYDIKKIYATSDGCWAIDTYGNIWVWGRNGYGQLGDGTRTDLLTLQPWFPDMAPWWGKATPTPVPATPTPTPTPTPTATPTPAPGLAGLLVAIVAALLLAGRKAL